LQSARGSSSKNKFRLRRRASKGFPASLQVPAPPSSYVVTRRCPSDACRHAPDAERRLLGHAPEVPGPANASAPRRQGGIGDSSRIREAARWTLPPLSPLSFPAAAPPDTAWLADRAAPAPVSPIQTPPAYHPRPVDSPVTPYHLPCLPGRARYPRVRRALFGPETQSPKKRT
jgi:hypothetical protein